MKYSKNKMFPDFFHLYQKLNRSAVKLSGCWDCPIKIPLKKAESEISISAIILDNLATAIPHVDNIFQCCSGLSALTRFLIITADVASYRERCSFQTVLYLHTYLCIHFIQVNFFFLLFMFPAIQ